MTVVLAKIYAANELCLNSVPCLDLKDVVVLLSCKA